MWFPVISAIVTLILTASFAVPTYFLTGFKDLKEVNPMVGYPLLFAFYFLSYFVVIFFNAALITCAHDSLMGRPTSFGQGMANAGKHLPAILGWAFISATVGVIIRTIAERTGIVGQIVVGIFGAAWNIVTFFVVPVIVVEDGSPVAALKKSGSMLKRTWGENVIGNAGIGIVLFLAAMAPIPLVVLGFASGSMVAGVALAAVAVLYWIALSVVGASLSGVYQTALYVYAETGATPAGFTPEYISGAFVPKKK